MKTVKKVLSSLITIISTLLFIVAFILVIVGLIAKNEGKIPKFFGYTYSVVSSSSMYPELEIGDVVITRSITFAKIKKGDIIVFYSPMNDKYIVHRVYEINEDGSLITKGDNNLAIDNERVYEENYIGKVMLKIPKLGKFAIEKNKRNYIFFTILLTLIGIIFIEIKNIIVYLLNNMRKNYEKELKNKIKEELEKDSKQNFDNFSS